MSTWKWPIDHHPVGYRGDGSYLDLHPTRYDRVWTTTAESWARWLVDLEYGKLWANTYYDHPASEYYPAAGGRDADSIDVWFWTGRGAPIGSALGNRVLDAIWPYRGDIEWLIWERYMYGDWNGWRGEPFGSNPFDWHDDHLHITLKKSAGGTKPPDVVPTDLSVYPGNCAHPEHVAWYFKYIAETQYGVPGKLPVGTSYVELGQAWDYPGCLEDIAVGYWTPGDHDSLGYFQQRATWGTYEQRTNAEWALRRFLHEARAMKSWEWNENTTDDDALGRWAQAVQGSAFPDRYRDRGMPRADELLRNYPGHTTPDEPEEPVEEPSVYLMKRVRANNAGWAYILEDNGAIFWLKAPVGMVFSSAEDEWLQRVGGTLPEEVWRNAIEREPDRVQFRQKGDKVELKDGEEMYLDEFQRKYRIVEGGE